MDDKQKIKHLEEELSRLKEGIPQLLEEQKRLCAENAEIGLDNDGHGYHVDRKSILSAPSPEISNLPSVPQLRWVKASESLPNPTTEVYLRGCRAHKGYIRMEKESCSIYISIYISSFGEFKKLTSWVLGHEELQFVEWLEELPSTEEGGKV